MKQELFEDACNDAMAEAFQTQDVAAIEQAIRTLCEVTSEMAERAGRMEQLITDINLKLDLTHQEFIASREESVSG